MLLNFVPMKIKTSSFADLFAPTSPLPGGTRRKKFLEALDLIIPWQAGLESADQPANAALGLIHWNS